MSPDKWESLHGDSKEGISIDSADLPPRHGSSLSSMERPSGRLPSMDSDVGRSASGDTPQPRRASVHFAREPETIPSSPATEMDSPRVDYEKAADSSAQKPEKEKGQAAQIPEKEQAGAAPAEPVVHNRTKDWVSPFASHSSQVEIRKGSPTGSRVASPAPSQHSQPSQTAELPSVQPSMLPSVSFSLLPLIIRPARTVALQQSTS